MELELRLLRGADERFMANLLRSSKKKNKGNNLITNQLTRLIVSVDGNDDSRYVKSFIDNIPARDSMYIRRVLKRLTPDIDLSQEFVCSHCDFETELEVPFNTEFFWPDR